MILPAIEVQQTAAVGVEQSSALDAIKVSDAFSVTFGATLLKDFPQPGNQALKNPAQDLANAALTSNSSATGIGKSLIFTGVSSLKLPALNGLLTDEPIRKEAVPTASATEPVQVTSGAENASLAAKAAAEDGAAILATVVKVKDGTSLAPGLTDTSHSLLSGTKSDVTGAKSDATGASKLTARRNLHPDPSSAKISVLQAVRTIPAAAVPGTGNAALDLTALSNPASAVYGTQNNETYTGYVASVATGSGSASQEPAVAAPETIVALPGVDGSLAATKATGTIRPQPVSAVFNGVRSGDARPTWAEPVTTSAASTSPAVEALTAESKPLLSKGAIPAQSEAIAAARIPGTLAATSDAGSFNRAFTGLSTSGAAGQTVRPISNEPHVDRAPVRFNPERSTASSALTLNASLGAEPLLSDPSQAVTTANSIPVASPATLPADSVAQAAAPGLSGTSATSLIATSPAINHAAQAIANIASLAPHEGPAKAVSTIVTSTSPEQRPAHDPGRVLAQVLPPAPTSPAGVQTEAEPATPLATATNKGNKSPETGTISATPSAVLISAASADKARPQPVLHDGFTQPSTAAASDAPGVTPSVVVSSHLDGGPQSQVAVASPVLSTDSTVASLPAAGQVAAQVNAIHHAALEPVATHGNSNVPEPAGERSQQLDTAAIEPAHRTLVATPTALEVGVPNGTQGWLRIRAEADSQGGVSASLAAGSSASQELLHRQLPALNAYLHSEQMSVITSVSDRSFAGAQGNSAGSSDVFHRSTDSAGQNTPGNSPAGAGTHSEAQQRNVPQVPGLTGSSRDLGSYETVSGTLSGSATQPAAQPAAGDESGRWLNVRV